MNLIKNYNKYRNLILKHCGFNDDADFDDCTDIEYKIENDIITVNIGQNDEFSYKVVKKYQGEQLVLFHVDNEDALLLFTNQE